jgi:hypothetical protein
MTYEDDMKVALVDYLTDLLMDKLLVRAIVVVARRVLSLS